MRQETAGISRYAPLAGMLWAACVFAATCRASGEIPSGPNSPIVTDVPAGVELLRYEKEFTTVRIEPARMGQEFGIAAVFEGTDDLHYYAKPETAPAAGFELKVEAKSGDFDFGQAVFPKWGTFVDPLGKKIEVYVGRFAVFMPITPVKAPVEVTAVEAADIQVKITGIACTSMICLPPFERILPARIDWSRRDSWKEISIEKGQAGRRPTQPIWLALGLAFLAGLALNIMPCVWPVLPLIVMRIVGQAKQSRSVSVAMGLAFCLGILLFFAILAGANIVLQVFYGTVLQWGDQFRNPAFVAGMALLLVVLALFMFGIFAVTVPSVISSKSSSGKGYFAAVGMGLLAAVLSTPCSFGILAAAFAWAQSQPLLPATTAIMVIGVGMALPYAVLTSIPGLLNRLPKPGKWMELFKQGIGFVLLIIAVKLITALPEARLSGVLYFAVVLGFCAWMWGTLVGYGTKPARRWLVRAMAAVLAVGTGWFFLPAPAHGLIDWQDYDAGALQKALEQERPVLIKFTADWCLSCQTVEKIVYSRKDIAELIDQKDVLAIKADTTEKDFPATMALEEIYNEPGVPISMLFVPGSEEPLKWRGMFFAGKLREHLEELPGKPDTTSGQIQSTEGKPAALQR